MEERIGTARERLLPSSPAAAAPAALLLGVALTVWKPTEWYAPAFAVVAAVIAFAVPGRRRVRFTRAGAVGVTVLAALRHLLYVDQLAGGIVLVLTCAILLYLSAQTDRSQWALPLATVLGAFLVATTGLELRLFNVWPLSVLAVGATLAIFLLLARQAEPRGSPWTFRAAAAAALVFGELFLAILFWPTAPAVGGALVGIGVGSALVSLGTNGKRVGWALAALAVILLATARWT